MGEEIIEEKVINNICDILSEAKVYGHKPHIDNLFDKVKEKWLNNFPFRIIWTGYEARSHYEFFETPYLAYKCIENMECTFCRVYRYDEEVKLIKLPWGEVVYVVGGLGFTKIDLSWKIIEQSGSLLNFLINWEEVTPELYYDQCGEDLREVIEREVGDGSN